MRDATLINTSKACGLSIFMISKLAPITFLIILTALWQTGSLLCRFLTLLAFTNLDAPFSYWITLLTISLSLWSLFTSSPMSSIISSSSLRLHSSLVNLSSFYYFEFVSLHSTYCNLRLKKSILANGLEFYSVEKWPWLFWPSPLLPLKTCRYLSMFGKSDRGVLISLNW